MKYYKDALYIAAASAYKDEVVDTDMEYLLIGEDGDFATKEEWLDEAAIERAA